jgi:hypothetical protein
MRRAFLIAAPFLLSACSAVVPPQAFEFDGAAPPARVPMAAAEHEALSTRVAQLRQERSLLREQISARPAAAQRLALYEALHDIDGRLAPLERRLLTVRPV